MTHDRAQGNTFDLTQESMAFMVGVTRRVVTKAAGLLQKEGIIRYSRGKVTILERKRLEASACQCYGVVKKEYDRVTRLQ